MSGETKFTAGQEAKRNAAEDMYEALERLEVYAKVQVERHSGNDNEIVWKPLLAALAKARGESQ